jgi:hypothetical protein
MGIGRGGVLPWGLSGNGVKLPLHSHLWSKLGTVELYLNPPYVFMRDRLSSGTKFLSPNEMQSKFQGQFCR